MTNQIKTEPALTHGLFIEANLNGVVETLLVNAFDDEEGLISVIGFTPGETPDEQGKVVVGIVRAGTFTWKPLGPSDWPSWATEAIDTHGLASAVSDAYKGRGQ